MSLLCRLGIHGKYRVEEECLLKNDLYHCRRCPGQWRIGGFILGGDHVSYRNRLADRN